MKEDTNITALPFSRRLGNTLQRNGCMTLGDILSKQPIEFKMMRGLGPVQFRELYGFLSEIKQ